MNALPFSILNCNFLSLLLLVIDEICIAIEPNGINFKSRFILLHAIDTVLPPPIFSQIKNSSFVIFAICFS